MAASCSASLMHGPSEETTLSCSHEHMPPGSQGTSIMYMPSYTFRFQFAPRCRLPSCFCFPAWAYSGPGRQVGRKSSSWWGHYAHVLFLHVLLDVTASSWLLLPCQSPHPKPIHFSRPLRKHCNCEGTLHPLLLLQQVTGKDRGWPLDGTMAWVSVWEDLWKNSLEN